MENLLHNIGNSIESLLSTNVIEQNVLFLPEGEKHPCIYLNPKEQIVYISGRSMPDNSTDFYRVVIEHLKNHFSDVPAVKAVFKFEYLGSSSNKQILDLLKYLEIFYLKGCKVEIFWYHEADDEEMIDFGEDFRHLVKIPFRLIELSED